MLCHNRACEVKSLIGNKYEYWISQEGLLLLGRWAAEGLSESRIAEKAGVRPDTLRGWTSPRPISCGGWSTRTEKRSASSRSWPRALIRSMCPRICQRRFSG